MGIFIAAVKRLRSLARQLTFKIRAELLAREIERLSRDAHKLLEHADQRQARAEALGHTYRSMKRKADGL